MKLIIVYLMFGIFGRMFAQGASETFTFIDEYLVRWDEFAQGRNELVPYIRENKERFEAELSRVLDSGERGAVNRTVFYAVVQIGGFIGIDSALGKAVTKVFGRLPVTEDKSGTKMFFAGDLFFWWEERKSDYPALPLYTEWEKREFTQSVVIPLYRSARENAKKG